MLSGSLKAHSTVALPDTSVHCSFQEYKFDVLSRYGQSRYIPPPMAKHHLVGGQEHVIKLYDRISGELMVLGFVAFIVWVCLLARCVCLCASRPSLTRSCLSLSLFRSSQPLSTHLFLSFNLSQPPLSRLRNPESLAYRRATNLILLRK